MNTKKYKFTVKHITEADLIIDLNETNQLDLEDDKKVLIDTYLTEIGFFEFQKAIKNKNNIWEILTYSEIIEPTIYFDSNLKAINICFFNFNLIGHNEETFSDFLYDNEVTESTIKDHILQKLFTKITKIEDIINMTIYR